MILQSWNYPLVQEINMQAGQKAHESPAPCRGRHARRQRGNLARSQRDIVNCAIADGRLSVDKDVAVIKKQRSAFVSANVGNWVDSANRVPGARFIRVNHMSLHEHYRLARVSLAGAALTLVCAWRKYLLGKGTFNGNATQDTCAQAVVRNVQKSRPFSQRVYFSAIGDMAIDSMIVHLFNICSPLAVFGRVRAVLVNALHGILKGGSVAHIGIEVLKGCSPAFTHDNTASAIVRVDRMFGIVAPCVDSLPNTVLIGLGHAVGSAHGPQPFRRGAPATCGVSAFHVRSSGGGFVSAIAETPPNRAPAWSDSVKCNDSQAVKALTTIVLDPFARKWSRVYFHSAIIP